MSDNGFGGAASPEPAVLLRPAPPPPPPPGTGRAGTASVADRRIFAGLIDLAPLLFLAVALGKRSAGSGGVSVEVGGARFWWWSAVFLAYYLIAELATGTTPGKALLGLCVRGGDGNRASKGQLVIRNLLRIVDFLPALYLLGLVTMAISPRRQRFGDLAARTVVAPRAEADEPPAGPRTWGVLAGVVVLTVAVGVAQLLTSGAGGTANGFSVQDDAVPYAKELIADAFQPPSVDALRSRLLPGFISDDDLSSLVSLIDSEAGSVTRCDEPVTTQSGVVTIRPGLTASAVDLEFSCAFEKGPGRLTTRVGDVDGKLQLLGVWFCTPGMTCWADPSSGTG